jgi:hypothetical protein
VARPSRSQHRGGATGIGGRFSHGDAPPPTGPSEGSGPEPRSSRNSASDSTPAGVGGQVARARRIGRPGLAQRDVDLLGGERADQHAVDDLVHGSLEAAGVDAASDLKRRRHERHEVRGRRIGTGPGDPRLGLRPARGVGAECFHRRFRQHRERRALALELILTRVVGVEVAKLVSASAMRLFGPCKPAIDPASSHVRHGHQRATDARATARATLTHLGVHSERDATLRCDAEVDARRHGRRPRRAARALSAGSRLRLERQYGKPGPRRQMHRCIPANGDRPHRFRGVLPREESLRNVLAQSDPCGRGPILGLTVCRTSNASANPRDPGASVSAPALLRAECGNPHRHLGRRRNDHGAEMPAAASDRNCAHRVEMRHAALYDDAMRAARRPTTGRALRVPARGCPVVCGVLADSIARIAPRASPCDWNRVAMPRRRSSSSKRSSDPLPRNPRRELSVVGRTHAALTTKLRTRIPRSRRAAVTSGFGLAGGGAREGRVAPPPRGAACVATGGRAAGWP